MLSYDAADPQAPAHIKAALGDTPVDLLLANAGAPGESGQALGNIHVDGVLELIRINALAPLKLVEALVYNLTLSQRRLVWCERAGCVTGRPAATPWRRSG